MTQRRLLGLCLGWFFTAIALVFVSHFYLFDHVRSFLTEVDGKYIFLIFSVLISGLFSLVFWYLFYKPTPLLMVKGAMTIFLVLIPLSAGWPVIFDLSFSYNAVQGAVSNRKDSNELYQILAFLVPVLGFFFFANKYVDMGKPGNRGWADQEW